MAPRAGNDQSASSISVMTSTLNLEFFHAAVKRTKHLLKRNRFFFFFPLLWGFSGLSVGVSLTNSKDRDESKSLKSGWRCRVQGYITLYDENQFLV